MTSNEFFTKLEIELINTINEQLNIDIQKLGQAPPNEKPFMSMTSEQLELVENWVSHLPEFGLQFLMAGKNGVTTPLETSIISQIRSSYAHYSIVGVMLCPNQLEQRLINVNGIDLDKLCEPLEMLLIDKIAKYNKLLSKIHLVTYPLMALIAFSMLSVFYIGALVSFGFCLMFYGLLSLIWFKTKKWQNKVDKTMQNFQENKEHFGEKINLYNERTIFKTVCGILIN